MAAFGPPPGQPAAGFTRGRRWPSRAGSLVSPKKRGIAGPRYWVNLQVLRQTETQGRPAIQLQVKTILNLVQRFVGFVYREVRMHSHDKRPESIEIMVEPHRGIRGRCSQCRRPAPGYDRLPERRWLFVPLWGIPTYFRYAPRRVECAAHGVVIEHIPWTEGKRPVTRAMMAFLARWARRLSWRETARVFQTSWEAVYRSDGSSSGVLSLFYCCSGSETP